VSELFEEAADDVVTLEDGRVTQVSIAGQPVVRDGALVNADLDEITAEAKAQAKRLWSLMERL
jgi:hypothetical protein